MIVNYNVSLKNDISSSEMGFRIRFIDISLGVLTVESNFKVPKYFREEDVPLNEVFVSISYKDILRIDENNIAKKRFLRKLNRSVDRARGNLAIIEVTFEATPTPRMVRRTLEFLEDFIYNHPYINLATIPKIIIRDRPEQSAELFLELIKILNECGYLPRGAKPLYFIPSTLTRKAIPKAINSYIDVYGSNALFIIDMDKGRFSSNGYLIVSQVIRELERVHNEENYGIYLFNHKPRKKSGEAVPSEDLLAIFNGVNIIGCLHGENPMPRKVVLILKDKLEFPKIFNISDFLYYPRNSAPNRDEFNKFLLATRASNIYRVASVYNDYRTNRAIRLLQGTEKEINSTLKKLQRPDFLEELKKVSRKTQRVLNQLPISKFISLEF